MGNWDNSNETENDGLNNLNDIFGEVDTEEEDPDGIVMGDSLDDRNDF